MEASQRRHDGGEERSALQTLEQEGAKLARKSVHAHLKSLYRFALKTLITWFG